MTRKRNSTKSAKRTGAKVTTHKNTRTKKTNARRSAPIHVQRPKNTEKKASGITADSKPKATEQERKAKPKTPQKFNNSTSLFQNTPNSKKQSMPVTRKSKVRTDKQPPKRKNVSQKILNGTMIHTRDEYLGSAHGFNKNGATEYYRQAIVVDSNRKNDLALIKLTTSDKGESVPGLKKSKYKPYIETKDNEGRPIRISKKFIKGRKKQKISAAIANDMKKTAVIDKREGEKNRNKLKRLKKRK